MIFQQTSIENQLTEFCNSLIYLSLVVLRKMIESHNKRVGSRVGQWCFSEPTGSGFGLFVLA
jgi:hypothetical protein